MGQRRGTLGNSGSTAKFQGETASLYAQKQINHVNTEANETHMSDKKLSMKSTIYRPIDTLFCIPTKLMDSTEHKRMYDFKKPGINPLTYKNR